LLLPSHEPLDFHLLAEVDQQANGKSCSGKVVNTLGGMDVVKCPDGFQFDKDLPLDQQIRSEFADQNRG